MSGISERRRARSLALQALYQWALTGHSASEIDAQFHAETNMDRVDVEYFQQLLRHVISHSTEMDASFSGLLDRPLRDLDPVTLSILRIGVFELDQRLDVPYKVVINEGINLAKKFGPAESARFVNGVLDKLAVRMRPQETSAARRGHADTGNE